MSVPLAFGGATLDGGLYTWSTALAAHSPDAWNAMVTAWADYGLALFAALMALVWWRARSGDANGMARALAVPLVVVACFGVNDAVKSVFDEQRPCQVLHTVTLETCPPTGDWSFPSNHAAIAAAAAVALLSVDRRVGGVAVVCAVLMGASRVWVGAHYPHDVVAGLVLGAAAARLLMSPAGAAAPLVERLRATRLRPLVAVG